jgi:hypothetical protein
MVDFNPAWVRRYSGKRAKLNPELSPLGIRSPHVVHIVLGVEVLLPFLNLASVSRSLSVRTANRAVSRSFIVGSQHGRLEDRGVTGSGVARTVGGRSRLPLLREELSAQRCRCF